MAIRKILRRSFSSEGRSDSSGAEVPKSLRRSFSSERRSDSSGAEVPKGCFAVYVGEDEKRRFVIPVSYLNHPSFRKLLFQTEEKFGFHHPMGGLTIHCSEDSFTDLISDLRRT